MASWQDGYLPVGVLTNEHPTIVLHGEMGSIETSDSKYPMLRTYVHDDCDFSSSLMPAERISRLTFASPIRGPELRCAHGVRYLGSYFSGFFAVHSPRSQPSAISVLPSGRTGRKPEN